METETVSVSNKQEICEYNNLDIGKLKNLRDRISDLGLVENIEVFKILQKNNVKYTENNNGVFINMLKLSQKTIDDLESFLFFIKNNNF